MLHQVCHRLDVTKGRVRPTFWEAVVLTQGLEVYSFPAGTGSSNRWASLRAVSQPVRLALYRVVPLWYQYLYIRS